MIQRKRVIAYLVRPAEGGIKSHVLTLMNGLDRTRFEPVLICPPDSSLYEEAEKAGHRVIPLDLVGEISPAKDLFTSLRLRWILHKVRPDVLHIHSAKRGSSGGSRSYPNSADRGSSSPFTASCSTSGSSGSSGSSPRW